MRRAFSRAWPSTLMTIAPRSGTSGAHVERELLGGVGNLGDGPLGDVFVAIELLELLGDLVHRGGGVHRSLYEGLLGLDVDLRDVELDLVAGRHLLGDLIEKIVGGGPGHGRQLFLESL